MNDDRFFGAFIGLVVGAVLMVIFSSIAMALDALPNAKYAPLITFAMMIAGALVGYGYVVVWTRWRAR